MRGTFANIRIKNEMLDGVEGGYTKGPDGGQTSIYDASMAYQEAGTPLVVIGGKEYGAGSSRDWAAKGTALLGVKAVIAESFERIHRSNLVGMGVIPFEFTGGDSRKSLGLTGDEDDRDRGARGRSEAAEPCRLHDHPCRWHDQDDPAEMPDRYRDRDRLRPPRRGAALRAAKPRRLIPKRSVSHSKARVRPGLMVLLSFMRKGPPSPRRTGCPIDSRHLRRNRRSRHRRAS